MKLRSILLILSAASVLLSASFSSQPQSSTTKDTELETHMKAINKGTRALRDMVKDVEQKDATLALMAELEGHALAAKELVPQRFATVAEDDQAEFMIGFRSGIIEMISDMLEVELAVLEERPEDATAALRTLLKLKNPSHKKFRIRKKKKGRGRR